MTKTIEIQGVTFSVISLPCLSVLFLEQLVSYKLLSFCDLHAIHTDTFIPAFFLSLNRYIMTILKYKKRKKNPIS